MEKIRTLCDHQSVLLLTLSPPLMALHTFFSCSIFHFVFHYNFRLTHSIQFHLEQIVCCRSKWQCFSFFSFLVFDGHFALSTEHKYNKRETESEWTEKSTQKRKRKAQKHKQYQRIYLLIIGQFMWHIICLP